MAFYKKKSQVKFGETFAIIVIVYIVIVMGMVWYNKVNTDDIYEIREKDSLNKAFEKYNFMVNSQFLHFSQQGDVDEEFDLMAIKSFYEYSQTGYGKEFVRKQLGESTIVIKLFDKTKGSSFTLLNPPILVYNNTPYESKKKSGRYVANKFRTLIPVVDSMNKKIKLGLLEVTVYD